LIDWTVVKEEHVMEACGRYVDGEEPSRRRAHNTFLLLGGKHYPAKYIRGLAYEIATGERLNPNIDYSGGAETVRFFKKLGYSTEYRGQIIEGNR